MGNGISHLLFASKDNAMKIFIEKESYQFSKIEDKHKLLQYPSTRVSASDKSLKQI